MAIVDLDLTIGDDTFEPRSFDPAPPGVYVCSVTGKDGKYPLEITQGKDSSSIFIPTELRIESNADGSETKEKGKRIFENIVLKKKDGSPNDGGQKQLVQFALACGVITEEQVRNKQGIDLNAFGPETRLRVDVNVKNEKDQHGNEQLRNHVKNYLWKD